MRWLILFEALVIFASLAFGLAYATADNPFKPATGQQEKIPSQQDGGASVAGVVLGGGAAYAALRLSLYWRDKRKELEQHACFAELHTPQPSFFDNLVNGVTNFFAGVGKAVGNFFAGIGKAVGDFVNWVAEHPWETISMIGIAGLIAFTGGLAAPFLGLSAGTVAVLGSAAASLFAVEAVASLAYMGYKAVTGRFELEDALYGFLNVIPYAGGAVARTMIWARTLRARLAAEALKKLSVEEAQLLIKFRNVKGIERSIKDIATGNVDNVRGVIGELRAALFFEKQGYVIKEFRLTKDGAEITDLVLEKGGRTYYAEVKSGALTNIDLKDLRKQLERMIEAVGRENTAFVTFEDITAEVRVLELIEELGIQAIRVN